ncbi:MAG: hypothetical protein ACUVWV_10470 [Thermodesulfobacteriota bacterium]
MGKDQEEIIELTEVWTEPAREEAQVSAKEAKPADPLNYEKELEKIEEETRERLEKWLATEGVHILNQGIREIMPPIFGEELGRELEKLKNEVEKIRVLKEGLGAKIKEWVEGEGRDLLLKETRDVLPKIGEELLGKEINQLQEEVEKIRGLREALNHKAEQWFQVEGVSVLKEKVAEALPKIVQTMIGQEIEKWRTDWLKIKGEQETWAGQMESWLAQEGGAILADKAREMFPEIAVGILKREIAKLKGEVEEQA